MNSVSNKLYPPVCPPLWSRTREASTIAADDTSSGRFRINYCYAHIDYYYDSASTITMPVSIMTMALTPYQIYYIPLPPSPVSYTGGFDDRGRRHGLGVPYYYDSVSTITIPISTITMTPYPLAPLSDFIHRRLRRSRPTTRPRGMES